MDGNILSLSKRVPCLKRYEEFTRLKSLSTGNRVEIEDDETVRKYGWVNGIDHKENFFDVIELLDRSS